MTQTLPLLKYEFYVETGDGLRKKQGEVHAISPYSAIIQMELWPYAWPDDWQFKPGWGKPEKSFGIAAMDVFAFYRVLDVPNWGDYGNGMEDRWYRIYEHREDGTILVYPEKETKNGD